MKKYTRFIVVLIIFCMALSLVNFAYAAPSMWGIAFNHETKECADYWSGDEFTYYELPAGWKAYYPYSDELIGSNYSTLRATLQIELGSFNYTEEEFWEMWPHDFCNLTGYTYVSENIGMESTTSWGVQNFLIDNLWLIILIIIILVALIVIVFKIKKKK